MNITTLVRRGSRRRVWTKGAAASSPRVSLRDIVIGKSPFSHIIEGQPAPMRLIPFLVPGVLIAA